MLRKSLLLTISLGCMAIMIMGAVKITSTTKYPSYNLEAVVIQNGDGGFSVIDDDYTPRFDDSEEDIQHILEALGLA